jgi:hypothetical protein
MSNRLLKLVILTLAIALPMLSPDLSAAQRRAPRRPDAKVIYCSYSGCPIGQTCMNCSGNWVCIYNGSTPRGCSGGPV